MGCAAVPTPTRMNRPRKSSEGHGLYSVDGQVAGFPLVCAVSRSRAGELAQLDHAHKTAVAECRDSHNPIGWESFTMIQTLSVRDALNRSARRPSWVSEW